MPYDAYSALSIRSLRQRHNPFIYFNAGTTNNAPYSASVVYDGPYSSAATWPDLTFLSLRTWSTICMMELQSHSGFQTEIAGLPCTCRRSLRYARDQNGLIILTMDENDFSGNQHIPTILIGDRIVGGQIVTQTITHYNVTKTVTDNFGAPAIGNSVGLADLIPLP